MYKTLNIQSIPVGKWFITHITGIRTLSSMYIAMSIRCTPLDKGSITHYNVRTLPYVHDDEYSGHLCGQRIHHTLHTQGLSLVCT